jgi:hypothetical protein
MGLRGCFTLSSLRMGRSVFMARSVVDDNGNLVCQMDYLGICQQRSVAVSTKLNKTGDCYLELWEI